MKRSGYPAQKSIVQKEGVGALFKGGLVRAIWTAPQGAMNFAGTLLSALPVLIALSCYAEQGQGGSTSTSSIQ